MTRILVVDDSPMDRRLAGGILAKNGFTVDYAGDGRAALQAMGIVPGDHVAILGPTSRELMTIIRGCWLAGAHHLDRFAGQGMWLRQFYVAATVCSPSRTAFMTSHVPARHSTK